MYAHHTNHYIPSHSPNTIGVHIFNGRIMEYRKSTVMKAAMLKLKGEISGLLNYAKWCVGVSTMTIELRWITMYRLLHLANSVSFLPMSCSLMLLNKIIKSIVHTKYHDYNFYKSCNFCFIGKNTCQLLWISWLFMWYSIRHTFTPLCWANTLMDCLGFKRQDYEFVFGDDLNYLSCQNNLRGHHGLVSTPHADIHLLQGRWFNWGLYFSHTLRSNRCHRIDKGNIKSSIQYWKVFGQLRWLVCENWWMPRHGVDWCVVQGGEQLSQWPSIPISRAIVYPLEAFNEPE